MITRGDNSFSKARFKNAMHSMSSMWTSSINNTYKSKLMGSEIKMTTKQSYSGYNFSFPLFSPFAHFCVDLIAKLRLNFPCIPGKQCQESLGSTIDHVNFMQGHGVDQLLSLLQFALRTLNKFCLATTVSFFGNGSVSRKKQNAHVCSHRIIIP